MLEPLQIAREETTALEEMGELPLEPSRVAQAETTALATKARHLALLPTAQAEDTASAVAARHLEPLTIALEETTALEEMGELSLEPHPLQSAS